MPGLSTALLYRSPRAMYLDHPLWIDVLAQGWPSGDQPGIRYLPATFHVKRSFRQDHLDEIVLVDDEAAYETCRTIARTEGILIGLIALWGDAAFLTPLLAHGGLGDLVSGGTLPLLYLAVGLKVGAELAGLLDRLAGDDEVAS